jgi:cell division inhibitor SepF
VVVCEPEKFEEVQALADHLKNRRQIILNFESTPPEVSQRIIDFISGSLYSLDGQSQQLGRNIFLFAPSNVEITKDHRTLMRRNSLSGLEPYGGDRKCLTNWASSAVVKWLMPC